MENIMSCIRCKYEKSPSEFSKKANGEIYKICNVCRDKLKKYKETKAEMAKNSPDNNEVVPPTKNVEEIPPIPTKIQEKIHTEPVSPSQDKPKKKSFSTMPPHPGLQKNDEKASIASGGNENMILYGILFVSGVFVGLKIK